jgi:hypothetical protein
MADASDTQPDPAGDRAPSDPVGSDALPAGVAHSGAVEVDSEVCGWRRRRFLVIAISASPLFSEPSLTFISSQRFYGTKMLHRV